MSSEQVVPVLGGRAWYLHAGTFTGNARLDHPEGATRVRDLVARVGSHRVVVPRIKFTNVLADSQSLEAHDAVIQRTSGFADGVLVEDRETVVGLMSADCATGLLVGPGGLAVMHLGLACLHRPAGEPTVVARAVERLGPPSTLALWLGAAVGPCCHGYRTETDEQRGFVEGIRRRWGETALPGRVRHGPRKGWVACDHLAIAGLHALQLGVGYLELDRRCTACAGLIAPDQPGYGTWFSNTRDTRHGLERNVVLAGLGPPPAFTAPPELTAPQAAHRSPASA